MRMQQQRQKAKAGVLRSAQNDTLLAGVDAGSSWCGCGGLVGADTGVGYGVGDVCEEVYGYVG